MIKLEDVTIVIPHMGGTQEAEYALTQCYNSLIETVPETKIIIARNGRVCQGHTWMRQATFIDLDEQGQCKAVNAAVATVSTPWVLVTNDDMVFPPGWWERLVSSMTDDMLCISPKLIEPRTGAPTFEVYFCGGAGGDFDKAKWLEFAKSYQGQGMRTGFNLPFLIKKETFDLVGGYDIQYDPWGASSDTDLQCKIELAGVKTYQNTNAIVYHFSQTSGTFEPKNHSYWGKNYAYFQEKWGYERPGDPDVWFSKDLIKYDQLQYRPWWRDFYKKETP